MQVEPAPAEIALVPAGRWTVDPEHSSVNFAVRHLGITTLRGRFRTFRGSLDARADDTLQGSAIIDVRSVDSGCEPRDRHLLGADFLAADQHPRMRYDLTAIRADIAGAVVAGELTLHGVTRPIELRASGGGLAQDPYGHDRCGLELRGQLDRRAFGINFDPSGFLVGDDVALAIDLSLVRAASDHHPPQVGLLSAQSTSAPIATRSAGSTSSGSG